MDGGLVFAIAFTGLVVVGFLWGEWRRIVEPVWQLSRRYGWRRGWRFYHFLGNEIDMDARTDTKPMVEGEFTSRLRKRLPKRRH